MTVRAIAIICNDNDFGSTFVNLLDTVRNILIWTPDVKEEVLRKIILEGIRFHYIAFQNQFDYTNGKATYEEHVQHIVKYLEKTTVLFNEEAEEATKEDHDSGAWYINIKEGTVYSF